jgi:4-aminobutyrate aminotransferase/(S)-3-amino-2-methylpropionate transaminase
MITTDPITELLERRRKVVPIALGSFSPATAVSAKGSVITDMNGREVIDFAGGIGVLALGHFPEPVVQAITEQAQKLIHTCFNVAMYEGYISLAEKLADLFPHGDKGTKVMLTNSGAEAVENAVKIARQATGKAGILCFTGAFHGRTMMAMSLTSKTRNKTGCGPYAPELYRIEFPDHYHYGCGLSEEDYLDVAIRKLEEFFYFHAGENDMAAAIVEVVQGEGGFRVMPKRYLQALRRLCTDHKMLLILDEVQSGFGRTGKWAAYEHYGVTPDLSTWAKAMGSSMPIGCVIGRAEVMDAAVPGTIGGTYPGNPVCCAASLATLRYMEAVDINARGEYVGGIIRRRMEGMAQKCPSIGQVRGLGTMMAFELVKNGDPWQPDTVLATQLVNACAEAGLLIITAGTYGNVIRVLCPLVIEENLLNRGLDILETQLLRLTERF